MDAKSEETELMIEALQRELEIVKGHLAALVEERMIGQAPSPEQQAKEGDDGEASSPERKDAAERKGDGGSSAHVQAAALTRDKHLLGVVESRDQERLCLRRQCLELMRRHIEQQLETQRSTGERLQRRLAKRQQRAKMERLHLKPPRYRSLGKDDWSFLSNTQKGTFYQIVSMEHDLKKTGNLKSLSQVKDFWELMLAPSNSTTDEEGPPHSAVSRGRPSGTPAHVGMATEDAEDGEHTNSWAITALCAESTTDRQQRSTSSDNSTEEYIPMRWERKELSHLLGERGPGVQEERVQRSRHVRRLQELEGKRKRTQLMYQQAKSNEMAMRRLLMEADFMSDQTAHPDSNSTPHTSIHTSTSAPTLPAHTPPPALPTSTSVPSTVTITSSTSSPLTSSTPPAPPNPPPPTASLTMESAQGKELHGKRKIWTNYNIRP